MTLTRVMLRNYKSVAACNVGLHPLSILIGRNGAGKSNFLDALRFVAEALRFSLGHALDARGAIPLVARRPPPRLPRRGMAVAEGHPRSAGGEGAAGELQRVGVRLDFELESGCHRGSYAFELSSETGWPTREICQLSASDGTSGPCYEVRDGRVVQATVSRMPPCEPEILHLVRASHTPEFKPAYAALAGMAFYSFNPGAIRSARDSTPDGVLRSDGSNLAEVVSGLSPGTVAEIRDYMEAVVPGVRGIGTEWIGGRQNLVFSEAATGRYGQPASDQDAPSYDAGDGPDKDQTRSFPALSVSDGTLRALAALVAMRQPGMFGKRRPSLVGIEEPEASLESWAAETLADAMVEYSGRTQILAACHSPDLLDSETLSLDSILVAAATADGTRIGPVNEVDRSVVRDGLATMGELVRTTRIEPGGAFAEPGELDIFGGLG